MDCRPAEPLDTLLTTVPIATLTFQFDPYAHLFGDLSVRWGAIALAAVIVAALLLAARLARAGGLRTDDVAFVAVGIVPGAVIGGRLGYLLLHQAYFGQTPELLLDPSVGGMELGLAVVGGFLTGTLRGEPPRGIGRALAPSRRRAGPVRARRRQAHDGPDRHRPGPPERCGLGQRLTWVRGRGGRSCRPCRRSPRRPTRGSRRWRSSPP